MEGGVQRAEGEDKVKKNNEKEELGATEKKTRINAEEESWRLRVVSEEFERGGMTVCQGRGEEAAPSPAAPLLFRLTNDLPVELHAAVTSF